MFSISRFVKNISFILAVVTASGVLSYGVLAAWTEPVNIPPEGNISAPIDAGPISQVKEGGLKVNALTTGASSGTALLVPNGNTGVGTDTPIAKLDVAAEPRTSAGVCTVTRGATVDTYDELTIGGTGCTFDALGIGEGSQIIVDAVTYKDGRIVTQKISSTKVAVIEDAGASWVNKTFEYVKTQAIKISDAAFTTNGMITFGGNYEGLGGISIPTLDMIVGGGHDSIFAIRHRDVDRSIPGNESRKNLVVFQNQNQTDSQATLALNTEFGTVGIGTIDPQGALDIVSTTGALIVPRMNTTQINALAAAGKAVPGAIVYDLTTNQFKFREGAAWVLK